MLSDNDLFVRVCAVVVYTPLVTVAALPPILRLATGVVDVTTNGAVPVATVDVKVVLDIFPETSNLYVPEGVFPIPTLPEESMRMRSVAGVPPIVVAKVSAPPLVPPVFT